MIHRPRPGRRAAKYRTCPPGFRGPLRGVLVMGLVTSVLIAGAGHAQADDLPAILHPLLGSETDANLPEASSTLLVAGDIASCDVEDDKATAQLLDGRAGTIATLGDNAYQSGTLDEFNNCYGPTWGLYKNRTRPSPGNHDYVTSGAKGYFDYFNGVDVQTGRAGDRSKGYYSYDLDSWHIIALNSNIDMRIGSSQEQWLRSDLAAHPAACTLAYWHHPRFNSGSHGNNESTGPLFQALYNAGAEVVLNGHEHLYEQFDPQTPDAQPDPQFGIREFVVGTGGAGLYPLPNNVVPKPNSDALNDDWHGILKLTLNMDGYRWEFLGVPGSSFADSGSGACHSAPAAGTTAPMMMGAAPAGAAIDYIVTPYDSRYPFIRPPALRHRSESASSPTARHRHLQAVSHHTRRVVRNWLTPPMNGTRM